MGFVVVICIVVYDIVVVDFIGRLVGLITNNINVKSAMINY